MRFGAPARQNMPPVNGLQARTADFSTICWNCLLQQRHHARVAPFQSLPPLKSIGRSIHGEAFAGSGTSLVGRRDGSKEVQNMEQENTASPLKSRNVGIDQAVSTRERAWEAALSDKKDFPLSTSSGSFYTPIGGIYDQRALYEGRSSQGARIRRPLGSRTGRGRLRGTASAKRSQESSMSSPFGLKVKGELSLQAPGPRFYHTSRTVSPTERRAMGDC